ncbi:MAG: SRPBCC domain-containing protein [Bacteroidetes bacterium]|nr:SRPBCC domain-containing protein [Bacteroidota bacterium]
MNKPLTVTNSIAIKATPSTIWDLLVNPEQTKKYMFGCAAVSDWKPGSPLLWIGKHEEKEMVFVKGMILDIQPEKFLAYTTIDPNNKTIEDVPGNYLTVTYELKTENGKTILTATQGDYSKVADGLNRYKHTVDGGGWQPILEEIKKLAETI